MYKAIFDDSRERNRRKGSGHMKNICTKLDFPWCLFHKMPLSFFPIIRVGKERLNLRLNKDVIFLYFEKKTTIFPRYCFC